MDDLTRRETEVMAALALTGKTAKELAPLLGISEQTLKNTLKNAYTKTNTHGSVEAFVALGWLCPPPDVAAAGRRAMNRG